MLVDRAEAGDVFGSITLVLGNPSTFEVAAIEDTLVYVLPGADFHALTGAHPDFAHFFDEQRTHRMRGAVATLQDSGSTMLRTSVRDLITRAPITIAQGATITEAARTMKEHGASSLLVMDGEALAGIVTDRDLRNRVLAVGLGADRPVQEVMTAGPVVGDADALAFEVLLEMVGRNIHHLPILEHDRPIGVVTTTDLMRMVQASPVYVVGDIQKQSDVEGVATVSARLPAVVEALVGQDASADDIGRVVTAIGDAVERRLIALAEAELGGAPACLLLGDPGLAGPPRAGPRRRPGPRADHQRRRDRRATSPGSTRARAAGECRARRVRLSALPRRRDGDQPALAVAAA
jgi:CBS domain-containing protein